MNLGAIIREAIEVVKRDYVLAAPAIIIMFVVAFLSFMLIKGPEALAALMVVGLTSMILNLFAHGVTVAMAKESLASGRTSFGTALEVGSTFFYHFTAAAFLVGLFVTLGFALMILPGVIAMFLFMFVFPAIVVDGAGPLESLVRSYRLVILRFRESLRLFLVMVSMGFIIMVVNVALSSVPVAGQLAGIALSGLMTALFSVMLTRAYYELTPRESESESEADAEHEPDVPGA